MSMCVFICLRMWRDEDVGCQCQPVSVGVGVSAYLRLVGGGVEVIIMMYEGIGVVDLDSVFDELNKKA